MWMVYKMYAISNDYKNLIENSLSLSPKSKIVVNGIEYTGSILKSYPKITHKNTTMIGGFPAKTCSFEIYDINNNLDFENKEITVYRGLDVNGTIEWIPQGVFIPTADKITTNISTKTISFDSIQDKSQLFDAVYTTNLTWLDGSTHTGLEIIQDICSVLGITLETTTFNWYDYSFKQPNFPSNITYREVISRLAEIGGSIAYISRTGGLVIKDQNTTGHSVARSRYGKLSKEKQFGSINVVVLGKDGVDDDIVYPSTLPENKIEWKILDNPFVDLYREEMIETVASYIIGQTIVPFELSDFVDGFYLDLNDTIQVTDKNGNTFNATLLNYESTSRIKSTIGADTQNNSITNYNLAGSNKQTILNVKSEVDHINGQIISVIEKQTEQGSQLTQQEMTLDGITTTVSNIQSSLDDYATTEEVTNIIEQTIESTTNIIQKTGGFNLLLNTQWYQDLAEWEVSAANDYSVDYESADVLQNTESKSELNINTATVKQTFQTMIGQTVTISFKYKKAGVATGGNSYVRIYRSDDDYVSVLEATEAQEDRKQVKLTYTSTVNTPTLVINSDRDDFWITDLVIQYGESDVWSPNATETRGQNYSLTLDGLYLKDIASGEEMHLTGNKLQFENGFYGNGEMQTEEGTFTQSLNVCGLTYTYIDDDNVIVN